MAKTALLEVRDKVAYVTLNRPEKLNAINNEMLGDLFEAFTEINDNRLQNPASAAVDADHSARSRGGVNHPIASAVLKQGLAAFYRIAFFDEHSRPQAGEIVGDDGHTGRHSALANDLDWRSRDRKVKPFGDLVK